ncbi:MAG: bifunctional nicotinamidase/pyrazinamidase [Spirochaetales bacterium]|jgi:nicotinamidase/pyrazinamidase|nr:bifunctional nicotinamidase/pyrazinamidase [Spirochaetales bacterium]
MSLQDIARKSALIVVDVQNDFCPGGSLAVRDGDTIVDVINRIAPAFGYAAATKDWHPAGHVSFASSHPGKKLFDTAIAGGISQTLWPDHCVQGTPGAELHPRLDMGPFSVIIHKGSRPGMDSYSAFFENDKKISTGLEFLLRGLGCAAVFLCGLATDVCVFYSCRDAASLEFDTFLIEDASKGVNPDSTRDALEKLKRTGVSIITSKEIIP